MVRSQNDVWIVFDDDDARAAVHQGVQHVDQLAHFVHVQAGGGLVQHVEGAGKALLAQFPADLDALGLAAGKGGGRLAQAEVVQAHFGQQIEFSLERHVGGEEVAGLAHAQVQHLGDVQPLPGHVQGFAVVALAAADFAGDEHVGQKVHFHADLAVAAAGFAAAAAHVEAEAAGFVAPFSGLLGGGEDGPDLVEDLGVGGRVGAGRAADGGLVDGHDLFNALQAADALDAAGKVHLQTAAQGDVLVQSVDDQRTLARAGHAGDAGQAVQGEGAGDVLQVVGDGVFHHQGMLRAARVLRPGDGQIAAQVLAGERIRGREQSFQVARENDFAAEGSGARSEFEDGVRGADGFFVVLHHKHGVAPFLELAQSAQQAFVVPGVQADARFIEHIGHAHQAGAELGGEADALGLAAGKGGHGPGQVEVLEAHIRQKAEAMGKFLDQGVGHRASGHGKFEVVHPFQGAADGEQAELVDVQVVHAHGQRFRFQPRAVAGRAGHGLTEAGQLVAPDGTHVVGLLQQSDDARPGEFFVALEQSAQGGFGVVGQGSGEGEAVGGDQGFELFTVAGKDAGILPGNDRALQQGKAAVGRDQGGFVVFHRADARTLRAGALGRVEGKKLRAGHGQTQAASGAYGRGAVEFFPAVAAQHKQFAASLVQGEFHGIGQAAAQIRFLHQTVHHQFDGVLALGVDDRKLLHGVHDAVHAHPDKALLAQLFQPFRVRPLLMLHQRGEDLEAFALRHVQKGGDDLIAGLGGDGNIAARAVGHAEAGEEDAQEIVDFRHRAHGGAWITAAGLLLQGNGRGESLDLVHVGLVHLGQELAGVGGKGFHIAPLPFGVDDVEGQGGLARTGGAADDHQLVPGDVQRDVLEIVLPGAVDMN